MRQLTFLVMVCIFLIGCATTSSKWFTNEPSGQRWFICCPTRLTSLRVSRPPDYSKKNLDETLAIIRKRYPVKDTDITELKPGGSIIVLGQVPGETILIMYSSPVPTRGFVVRRTGVELVFDLWEYRRGEPFPPIIIVGNP